MGSNSFRRIVGHFAGGKYTELSLDSNTMGVTCTTGGLNAPGTR